MLRALVESRRNAPPIELGNQDRSILRYFSFKICVLSATFLTMEHFLHSNLHKWSLHDIFMTGKEIGAQQCEPLDEGCARPTSQLQCGFHPLPLEAPPPGKRLLHSKLLHWQLAIRSPMLSLGKVPWPHVLRVPVVASHRRWRHSWSSFEWTACVGETLDQKVWLLLWTVTHCCQSL